MPSMRILIIEDEAIIGMLLSKVLIGMGHTVIAVVGTESAATALAAEHLPDFLIVDAGLTTGNGISAVDNILTNRFIPHIFTTGDLLKVRQIKPEAIILEKPYHETELAEAIGLALAKVQQ
jgi:two-component system, response regulator PdtaR